MTIETKRRPVERKFAGMSVADIEADGTFSGYASLFGKPDMARDVVERGAFRRSLRLRRAQSVRMLFQHDPGQPIGRWLDIREDERGLFVRGRLTPGVAKSAEVLQLLRAGALDGLSIGFRTVRARKDLGAGVRRILEADLWEVSIVTFPMLPEARIDRVKAYARRSAATGGWPGDTNRRLAGAIREAAMQLNGKEASR